MNITWPIIFFMVSSLGQGSTPRATLTCPSTSGAAWRLLVHARTTPQVLLVGAQSVSAATPLMSLQCGAAMSLMVGTVAPKSAYAQRTPTPILEQFQDLTKKT